MTTATVDELRARLGEYLERVEGGEEVIVVRGGAPIARFAPAETSERRAAERAGRLDDPYFRRRLTREQLAVDLELLRRDAVVTSAESRRSRPVRRAIGECNLPESVL